MVENWNLEWLPCEFLKYFFNSAMLQASLPIIITHGAKKLAKKYSEEKKG